MNHPNTHTGQKSIKYEMCYEKYKNKRDLFKTGLISLRFYKLYQEEIFDIVLEVSFKIKMIHSYRFFLCRIDDA